MSSATVRPRGKRRDTYFKRVRRFPLVCIRDDRHLAEAQRVIDAMLQEELDPGAEAYLDVLSDLVSRYEDEHHPVPDATQAEVLALLLESNGMSQADLVRKTGIAKATVSDLVAGRRTPTVEQMGTLAKLFHLSPAVFLPAVGG